MVHQIIQNLFGGRLSHSTESVRLIPGQLFQGSITQWYPNQLAQLRLGTFTITGKLEAKLEKGKPYWFRVMEGEGIPRLKVLEEVPPVEKGRSHQTNTFIEAVLKQNNLQKSDTNVSLIQRLIAQNLPFTRQDIVSAEAILKNLTPSNKDIGIQTIVKMMKSGYPLTKETFSNLLSLTSDQSISDSIAKLGAALGRLKNPSPDATQLHRMLEDITFKPERLHNRGISIQGNMIRSVLDSMGYQHERNLLEHPTPTLKSLLLQLVKSPMEQTGVIRAQAEFLLHRITALQLVSKEETTIAHTIVQIPVELEGEYRDWTMQWSGRKKQTGEIDENHCRILFYLTLNRLGETIIDTNIQNRVVSLTIYTEGDRPSNFQDNWFPLLDNKLQSFNYHLSSIKWKKLSQQKNNQLYTPEYSKYNGVDIRV